MALRVIHLLGLFILRACMKAYISFSSHPGNILHALVRPQQRQLDDATRRHRIARKRVG